MACDHKGLCTHNCLAGCDFDHNFTYLSTGWEGSVSYSTMYFDAHTTDLIIQPGKYYLADAGFPLANALLTPYRGVQYHLAEWGHADLQCVVNTVTMLTCSLAQPLHRNCSIFNMHQLAILLRGCLVS